MILLSEKSSDFWGYVMRSLSSRSLAPSAKSSMSLRSIPYLFAHLGQHTCDLMCGVTAKAGSVRGYRERTPIRKSSLTTTFAAGSGASIFYPPVSAGTAGGACHAIPCTPDVVRGLTETGSRCGPQPKMEATATVEGRLELYSPILACLPGQVWNEGIYRRRAAGNQGI